MVSLKRSLRTEEGKCEAYNNCERQERECKFYTNSILNWENKRCSCCYFNNCHSYPALFKEGEEEEI